jgi:hypothetical protein
MSGKIGGAFAAVKRAPTRYLLPDCPNGHGEMLALDDGWQCPVCNWYRGYYRGERHP